MRILQVVITLVVLALALLCSADSSDTDQPVTWQDAVVLTAEALAIPPIQAESVLIYIELARSGRFFGHVSNLETERVKYVLDQWSKIMGDPANSESLFFGHPYCRWATFLASSPMEELVRTQARIYLGQGTADDAVSVHAFGMLFAQLTARGKNVTIDRIDRADHNLRITNPDGSTTDGWPLFFDRLITWFLH